MSILGNLAGGYCQDGVGKFPEALMLMTGRCEVGNYLHDHEHHLIYMLRSQAEPDSIAINESIYEIHGQ